MIVIVTGTGSGFDTTNLPTGIILVGDIENTSVQNDSQPDSTITEDVYPYVKTRLDDLICEIGCFIGIDWDELLADFISLISKPHKLVYRVLYLTFNTWSLPPIRAPPEIRV